MVHPTLKGRSLDRLATSDVEAVMRRIRAPGLSDRTRRRDHGRAARVGAAPARANPAAGAALDRPNGQNYRASPVKPGA